MRPGPRNLITDVPGPLVGNAADDDLKSGTTVLQAKDRPPASDPRRGRRPGAAEH